MNDEIEIDRDSELLCDQEIEELRYALVKAFKVAKASKLSKARVIEFIDELFEDNLDEA